MTVIIDRRREPMRHKFDSDKAKFLHRIREAVKKAINKKVSESKIQDLDKDGVRIPIPKKLTQEPVIQHKQGPVFKKVFPGNLYDVGDTIPIPSGGSGGQGEGDEASPDAEDGIDDFVWLSQEEFLDIFFEGRVLPDMNKLHSEANSVVERQRFGHTSKGPSHKMDMRITNAKRKGEALILNKKSERQLSLNLVEQYNIYRTYNPDLPELTLQGKNKTQALNSATQVLENLQEQFTLSVENECTNPTLAALFNCISLLEANISQNIENVDDMERLEVLRNRTLEQMKAKKCSQKFQNRHLTYKFDEERPKPAAKAVMICKMDVSGSMTQEDKNVAKSFFWVLNKFLESNYEEVEMVFISHTTTAEEVDEQDFFYGTRTGGTLVSSCLEKELEIIKERYPTAEWNIYSAQASDGDNARSDNDNVVKLMQEILPMQQASYFIEIRDKNWGTSILHKVYQNMAKDFSNLKTAAISSPGEAIKAFEDFFPVGGAANTNEPGMR